MRRILKKDDGWLDILIKFITIGAFIFAIHQYYYRIFPVWKKEHQLEELSEALSHKEKEVASQEAKLQQLVRDIFIREKEIEVKSKELSSLQEEKNSIEQKYQDQISELQKRANALQDEWNNERLKLRGQLSQAQDSVQAKNLQMVGTYLDKYSHDVFLIQIDNIRWSKGSGKLDLKRDISDYVKAKLKSADSDVEKVSLDIFKMFADKELKNGEKDYSNALQVLVFYRFDPRAKELIASL